jgi:hypothetical protein
LNRFYIFEGWVAAEVKTGPAGALARGPIADQPGSAASGLLDRLFADSAPGAEESRMTTAATECFAIITDWRRQFRAALRIAAVMPQILDDIGDLLVGLRRGGRYFKGIQHDAFRCVPRVVARVG